MKGSVGESAAATTQAPDGRNVLRAASTLGHHPSVATRSAGGRATVASTSPPPVSMSSAAVARAMRSPIRRA